MNSKMSVEMVAAPILPVLGLWNLLRLGCLVNKLAFFLNFPKLVMSFIWKGPHSTSMILLDSASNVWLW